MQIKFYALALFFIAFSCFAARMTIPEASFTIDQNVVSVRVNKDGTTVALETIAVTLKNEDARSKFSTIKLNYDPQTESIKVLAAETRDGKKKFSVSPTNIIDKPATADLPGFDNRHDVTIVFPSTEIGRQIYYQFERRVRKTFPEGRYSMFRTFSEEAYTGTIDLTIESAIPLSSKSVDPDHVIEVAQTSKKTSHGDVQVWKTHLKTPYLYQVVREPDALYTSDHYPRVYFTSHPGEADYWGTLSPRYEKVLQAAIPPQLQAVIDLAQQEKTIVSRLNRLTSEIANRFRYQGDWRAVDGALVPRSLKEIATTGYGDCKDFAILVTKGARELGYEANPALILRGNVPPEPSPLATGNDFNHAISQVRHDGVVYWLDGTNVQSNSGQIFSDIADREALVLKTKAASLERTPAVRADENVVRETWTTTVTKSGIADIRTTMDLKGASSIPWTAASLFNTKEALSEEMTKDLLDAGDIRLREVEPFDFSSRVVSPIRWATHLVGTPNNWLSNAGYMFTLGVRTLIKDLFQVDQYRFSGFLLTTPVTHAKEIEIREASIVGSVPDPCESHSPWMDFSRVYQNKSRVIRLTETGSIKKNWIRIEEIQSPEFRQFRAELKKCHAIQTVIFKTHLN